MIYFNVFSLVFLLKSILYSYTSMCEVLCYEIEKSKLFNVYLVFFLRINSLILKLIYKFANKSK